MVTSIRGWTLGCVISGAILSAFPALGQDNVGVVHLGGHPSAGVVRISDQGRSAMIARGQSDTTSTGSEMIQDPNLQQTQCANEDQGEYVNPRYAPSCPDDGDWHPAGFPHNVLCWIRNDLARKGAWIRGKTGHHGGHCRHDGPGRPLAGCYTMVYPVDPSYFDQRDGQVYAASGYGGPVSVPLAPVVNSTYNYGWGIPSSRLTPVLHPATQAPVSQIPNPLPTAPISY